MADLELFDSQQLNIGKWFGLQSDFLNVTISTVLNTWFILFLLLMLVLFFRYFLDKKSSLVRYVVLSGVSSFMDLITQTLGRFIYGHFVLITSLFVFIVLCNCVGIIPWTTEPTTDINTTLALGLVSFFYKDFYAIKVQGFSSYIKDFFYPFFLMFPINLIGHFSKIVSISFRLFGNIFGGSIIMELYKSLISGSLIFETVGLFSGFNFIILIFFGIFEGLIQAFVFSMLSLTYLALAIQEEPAGET